jgi:hypothetical protein
MKMNAKHYTPYEDINSFLDILLDEVKTTLRRHFIGMYLYGSLSSGDFNPKSSDIDFAVVTPGTLPDKTVSALKQMHERIWRGGLKWAPKLEGSYLPKDLFRRHDPKGAPCPTVNEGRFYLDRRGSDWIIQRHVIRESGVVLEGPDPRSLIDHVSSDDIRRAVLGVLQEWWFPMLDDQSWLANHGSEYHAYTILSMCRALHAMEYGVIVSKPAAARWAQGEFGQEWKVAIQQALAAQGHFKSDVDLYDRCMELIHFTQDKVKAKETHKRS